MTTLAAENPVRRAVIFQRGLLRLCAQAQSQLWGLRLGRLYGVGIGVSYGLMAWAGRASPATAAQLWARCLATASWVAGVGALSLATDLATRDATQGLSGLARLRGFGEVELERARTLAGALRLAATVATPGLMLAAATGLCFHNAAGALAALGLALATLPYAALVGATLATLARLCSQLLPTRGRTLLLAVTLGPWLLGLGLGVHIPSLPRAFSWLLQHSARSFH